MAKKRENGDDERLVQALARFGKGVQRRRAELDMTQRQAAKRAGISQSNWSKIERGQHDLSVGQALRVQFALGAESLEGMLGDQPSALVLASGPKSTGQDAET